MCYDVLVSTRLHIVVSDELVARIDAALGVGQPRADFIRRAVEQALGHSGLASDSGSAAARRPDPASAEQLEGKAQPADESFSHLAGVPVVRASALAAKPYRQSVPGPDVENIRSSDARPFRPYPKGGKGS